MIKHFFMISYLLISFVDLAEYVDAMDDIRLKWATRVILVIISAEVDAGE